MAFSFRRLGKRFFITINFVAALAFALGCLQQYLHPENFWLLGFMGILMPYLILVLLAFVVFWLIWRSKWILLSILTLLLGYRQVGVLFALNRHDFNMQKPDDCIRVISWNIKGFNGLRGGHQARRDNADSIFILLERLQPDIICFQEYGQYEAPNLGRDYQKKLEQMGYPHHVLSRDYSRRIFSYSSGSAIFSRHPLVAARRIPFTSNIESVIFADVLVKSGDTLRVFNTHLQSFKLTEDELEQVEKVKNKEKPSYAVSTSLLGKMKRAFRNRGSQVDQITPLLDSTLHPEMICLDMNDVPNSYSYWKLRGNRQDAFLAKGWGLGRTFITIAPTLRIDYIFADPRLQVKQFAIMPQRYSDHLCLVADLQLPQ